MTTKVDDLEAVRQIVGTLQPFADTERERILRWAREKLGMGAASVTLASPTTPVSPSAQLPITTRTVLEAGQDIASFAATKKPKSDVHFAAVVAYYYQFISPVAERKEAITKEDLVDACRKADRKRPKRPAQVLVDGYHEGLLDRGDRGQYRLNSVGENLVAMVLPGDGDRVARNSRGTKTPRRSATRKPKRSARR